MNKWKLAFWTSFGCLIVVLAFYFYLSLDQAVTLNYQNEAHITTENDLNLLIQMINNTDLSKEQIETNFASQIIYKDSILEKDTILLSILTLVFKEKKLVKVIK